MLFIPSDTAIQLLTAKTRDNLAEIFNINVMSVQNVTTVFLPLLERSQLKKVANMSTTVSSFAYQDVFVGLPAPAYKVTKAALNMLTLQWGMEYRDKGFTIFGVSPGVSDLLASTCAFPSAVLGDKTMRGGRKGGMTANQFAISSGARRTWAAKVPTWNPSRAPKPP